MLKLFVSKLLKLFILLSLVLSFFVLSNIFTYKRFTHEKPIAHLTFTPVNHQEFDASLRIGNFCENNLYRIYGDEWRIDAQFLKWKSWATLLGLDAMYRLDRLSGRYSNIVEENSKTHSAHELKSSSTLDLSKIAERYNNKFPPIDTIYGSSAYEKMRANILYTVSVNQSGILVREKELVDISQENVCVQDNSWWKNSIVNLDQKLNAIIKLIRS